MIQFVESKVYVPVPVSRVPQQHQARVSDDVIDSPQKSVQAFVDSLPQNVRDRIGQKPQQTQDQDTEQTGDQKASSTISDASTSFSVQASYSTASAFSSPFFAVGLALLQAQSGFLDQSGQGDVSQVQRTRFHQAYLSAGAQAGGETAAREAGLKQQEAARQIYVVPPVLSNVNLFA